VRYAAQKCATRRAADAGRRSARLGGKLANRLKAIFVGISVAVLIVVALRFAATYFRPPACRTVVALAERQAPIPPAPARARRGGEPGH
jgi:hypothetical protein